MSGDIFPGKRGAAPMQARRWRILGAWVGAGTEELRWWSRGMVKKYNKMYDGIIFRRSWKGSCMLIWCGGQ